MLPQHPHQLNIPIKLKIHGKSELPMCNKKKTIEKSISRKGPEIWQ